ncbi:MAG: damage-control phosphatase ARMT1 family protein [Candidatus Asgardarchaeia archaeon]
MKSQCIACVLNIRFKDLEMIDASDEEKRDYAIKLLENYTLLLRRGINPPPKLLCRLFRIVKRISKVEDPYFDEKKRENMVALRWYNNLKKKLEYMDRDEKLTAAIKIAAVGNAIDPSVYAYDFKFEDISKEFLNIDLAIDDSAILRDVSNKKIVYLLDNCGEALLDRILAEVLRERGAKVIGVVKGGTFQNDITIYEVKEVNLEESFDEIIDTGTDAASIFWDEISERARKEILSADIVIAKGLANFEYMTEIADKIPAKKLHIFKVKCRVVSEYVNAPINSYVAKLIS